MKRILVPTGSAVLIAAIAIVIAVVASSHDPSRTAHPASDPAPSARALTSAMSPESVPQGPSFPANASGLTYGAVPDAGAAPYKEWPDLVSMYVAPDEIGFVHKADLHESDDPEDNPSTPEEMEAFQSRSRVITIYAADGTTVLAKRDLAEGTTLSTTP